MCSADRISFLHPRLLLATTNGGRGPSEGKHQVLAAISTKAKNDDVDYGLDKKSNGVPLSRVFTRRRSVCRWDAMGKHRRTSA